MGPASGIERGAAWGPKATHDATERAGDGKENNSRMALAAHRKTADRFAAVLIAGATAYAVFRLRTALRGPLVFDDSYMFYRYAMNIRHGLGMSWNLDGVPTYGETAPLWGVAVLLLSCLPVAAPHALIAGSWLCGSGAAVAMAWAAACNAQSGFMKSVWRVLPMVAVPLALSPVYRTNLVTGMETMFAVMLAAVFLGLVLGWERGRVPLHWSVLAGVALFLTRPESALAVLLVPFLFALFGQITGRALVLFAGLFAAGLILDLLVCKLYFGYPLPLSFYMKSGHAYEGYHTAWHPLSYALFMLANSGLFLGAIVLLARKQEWKLVGALVLPALVAFAYLCTVTQIMGWQSRYYVPYLPFFAIPALLVVDRRIAGESRLFSERWFVRRIVLLGGTAILLVGAVLMVHVSGLLAMLESADRKLERRPYVYDSVAVETAASRPLPFKSWYENIHEIGDVLLAPLPKGTTIAASEVGFIGAANPGANVIDIEGLNDNRIALHGFDMEALLKRAPDILWMPHPDYTYQRGVMMTDPHLLEQYDLYAGVGGYGLALRKDSPVRPSIDRRMKILWQELYPGYTMEDYRVRSTSWTGRRYIPNPEEDRKTRRNNLSIAGQF